MSLVYAPIGQAGTLRDIAPLGCGVGLPPTNTPSDTTPRPPTAYYDNSPTSLSLDYLLHFLAHRQAEITRLKSDNHPPFIPTLHPLHPLALRSGRDLVTVPPRT